MYKATVSSWNGTTRVSTSEYFVEAVEANMWLSREKVKRNVGVQTSMLYLGDKGNVVQFPVRTTVVRSAANEA